MLLQPRECGDEAVDELGMRLTAPRQRHQREGHERFTLSRILAEEVAVLDLADARDGRAQLWVKEEDTRGLSADPAAAVKEIGRSPWLVHPWAAPAGAGTTTPLQAVSRSAFNVRRCSCSSIAPRNDSGQECGIARSKRRRVMVKDA